MVAPARVRIALRSSRILTGVLGLAHAAAMVVTFIVMLPLWVKLLLGTAIISSCAWSIYRSALLLHTGAIIELEAGEGGRTSFRTRDGAWHDAHVLGSSLVSPWLTVLNVRPEAGRRVWHIVILPDSADPEAFRSLRVLLRWSRPAAEASAERQDSIDGQR